MNHYIPLFMIDNKHSQAVFFLMTIALFIILGTLSLYIKEVIWGFGVFIFLTGLLIFLNVKATKKDVPRFFAVEDKSFEFIYWNRSKKIIKFSDIESIIVDGSTTKSVITVLTIKTKNETVKIFSEIFDSTLKLISMVHGIVDIEYRNKFHEKAIKEALNANFTAKKLRIAITYFWVLIFLAIAIIFSLKLTSIGH